MLLYSELIRFLIWLHRSGKKILQGQGVVTLGTLWLPLERMCSKIGHHLVSKQAGINKSVKHTIVVGPEKCCCCCCVLYSSRLKKSLSTKTLQSFLPLICTLPWIYTVRFFFCTQLHYFKGLNNFHELVTEQLEPTFFYAY